MNLLADLSHFMPAFLGGILIGLASALLLLGIGRIAGISSIVAGTVFSIWGSNQERWRLFFILGLVLSPWCWFAFKGDLPVSTIDASTGQLIIAGLLVGLGTRLGSGCTSGHGICGLSRLSKRSIVATLTFMTVAMVTVALVRGRLG